MTVRKYHVLTRTAGDKVTALCVSDAMNKQEWNTRPIVAEFPVSQAYDELSQERRAETYRDYMNKLVEAAEVAYKQTMLCDILKA